MVGWTRIGVPASALRLPQPSEAAASSMPRVKRVRTPELMDDPSVPPEDLEQALAYIRRVNRHLGGAAALLHHLRRWSRQWPRDRPVTLLDIATGSADLPLAAREWAAEAGFDLRVTGIDVHPTTLALARAHVATRPDLAAGITLLEADARRLMDRFAPGSFDYVHSGLFLHHLPEIEILTVLRIMDRLASRGTIWNDLVRSRTALAAIHILTLGRPPIIRHDAIVSVRAGFTRREALDLARRSDWTAPTYRRGFFTQRFTVTSARQPVQSRGRAP
jgi:ubiquinone/menaquinone biosynthesis C-methylase UbiE